MKMLDIQGIITLTFDCLKDVKSPNSREYFFDKVKQSLL